MERLKERNTGKPVGKKLESLWGLCIETALIKPHVKKTDNRKGLLRTYGGHNAGDHSRT